MRINGHGHLLPYPDEIPAFMREKEIFWIDEDRKFMRQKNWQRPVTDPSFFLNEKLEWMEQSHIDHAVILSLSQLYGNGLKWEHMKRALRFQNDFNARIQQDYPKKFTCGFVVHAGFTQGALWEIERCVEELGLQEVHIDLIDAKNADLAADGKFCSLTERSEKARRVKNVM